MNKGKRTLFLLLTIIIIPLLAGCGRRTQAREVEQLLIVQTMGLDRSGGVSVSLASGASLSADGKPVRLLGRGASITQALAQIRAGASEEDLFCSHLGHLLIGEATARQSLAPIMDYVCRAGELRLSVPVYVLRDGAASAAVLGVGDDSFGVSDALDAVDGELRQRGDGSVTEAADLLRDLYGRGSALVCAVSLSPSAENAQAENAPDSPQTLTASGYGVLQGDRLVGWLDRSQAVGVGLLTGRSGLCELSVTDQAGLPVTLCITEGQTRLVPHWTRDGALAALELVVEAQALLAEDADGATAPYYLQQALDRSLSERVREVLSLSKQWRCDFLGIEQQLRLQEPQRMRAMKTAFADRWPSLPLIVSVETRLAGTGDVEGGS